MSTTPENADERLDRLLVEWRARCQRIIDKAVEEQEAAIVAGDRQAAAAIDSKRKVLQTLVLEEWEQGKKALFAEWARIKLEEG